MRPTSLAFTTFLLALSLLARTSAADVDVNALGCGASFDGRGFLSADLDCPGSGVGTFIGRLELRGFTLVGNFGCGRRCQIVGPGTISASGFAGVAASSFGTLKLTDVTLEATGHGIFSYGRVTLSRSAVTAGESGIIAIGSVTLLDSSVTAAGGAGAVGHSARLVRSTIQGSARFGVAASRRAALIDSTVTANGTDPDCGVSVPCADLLSRLPPRLLGTSACGHSMVWPADVINVIPPDDLPFPGTTWGACALD